MSFSPGVNEVSEPVLFGAPECEVCGGEMPERKGTGRRAKYCSKACSSKADRQRERERRDALVAAAATTESPRGETGAPVDGLLRPLGFPVGTDGGELLEAAAELYRQTRLFVIQLHRAARNTDSDLLRSAGADMRSAAYVLTARHSELVGQMLAEHPLAAPAPPAEYPEPGVLPRGETFDAQRIAASVDPAMLATHAPAETAARPAVAGPAAAAESTRGETTAPEAAPQGAQGAQPFTDMPRGETSARADGPSVPPPAPRGETPADPETRAPVPGPALSGDRLRDLVDERLAQQGPSDSTPADSVGTVSVPRDPLQRGLPRSMDVRIPLDENTFGYNWVLAGWTVQPDVLVVLGEGHPVGWVERGLDGGEGWVAVYGGYFLGDPATQQAILHDTAEQAAQLMHQAYAVDL
ncbi:hypothetical protein [Streptomyces sp. TLI_171]|uniref:hypothetical protein n=1 Tax=Streptomyces sp. TLI_171 TaxID=1938859 RepID=UPI000C182F15|nr:hypothetical protein [Streptomyces sp. TLI_171]RKE02959.1 hypothetical protein BX266_7563 [Streptomyces sp. TLI_171]